MSFPQFSMRELLDAGVHFGHKTKRWNPRMAPYLYGVRNDVHIIDLQKTVPLLHQALLTIKDTVAKNGKILFVGTKHQAAEPVAEAAKRCGQFYVNQRWLGGMLTNWHTIQASIKTLRKLDEQLGEGGMGLTKKEVLSLEREKAKLERSLGGIKDMRGVPDLLIIIDINKDDIAVQEARRLGIPIIAILDSNSSPEGITLPIPGNDDSTRAIKLYCQLFSDAALSGIQESLAASGVDIGESENPAEVLKQSEREKAEAAEAEREKRAAGRKGRDRDKEEKPAKKAPVVMKKGEARGAVGKKSSDEESVEEVTADAVAEDADGTPKKAGAKKSSSTKTKKAS